MNSLARMHRDGHPFRDIEPRSPEYLELVKTAIQANDKQTLSALRGNVGKPIRLVNNWGYYALMASGWEKDYDADKVVIYTPETYNQWLKFEEHCRNNPYCPDDE